MTAAPRVAPSLWRRSTRSRALRIAVVAGLVATAAYQTLRPRKVRLDGAVAIAVEARPIRHFSRTDVTRTRFGKLEFRGGLVLTSTSPYFGGWSALALDARGHRLLAISDTGAWMTGEIVYDGAKPAGLAGAVVGPLLDKDGAPFKSWRDRDSEGLAIVAGSVDEGEALISFEINDRIGRFPVSGAGVGALRGYLPLPRETRQLTPNVGLESVCTLAAGPAAGSIVTLVERFPGTTTTHTGWIGKPDGGSWRRLALDVVDDYDLTDCHGLADGGMLVLERRFHLRDWLHGPRMRVRRFSAAELAGTTPMAGEVLLDAGPGEDIDNMEGIAVHSDESGATVVTIVSDDNFNHAVQRTVLLQFALAPAPR